MTELSKVYDELINHNITCTEAADAIKSGDVKSFINAMIYKDHVNKLIPYNENDLQAIYMIINITQYIYNNSGEETGLTDSEYDTLYEILLSNDGSDVISAPIASNNVRYHKYPGLRGTLAKTYYLTTDEERKNPSRKYLDEWKKSMENKIFNNSGKRVNLDNEEIYVFPKFDGVSAIFEMNDDGTIQYVLTRGFTETNEAQDITHQLYNYPRRKHNEIRGEYGLKTEIMMSEKDLEYFNTKYKTNYKNTRSIVSAILNSDEYDDEKSRLLHVVPLRVGSADGHQELATEVFDYPYLRCLLRDREVIREFSIKHKYINGELRCDGAVLYFINPEIQKLLGRENNKNNFEVAYKFTEETALTEIVDVIFNVGLFGRIAPIAKIKPVKLKGNTIENISLGSIGRFQSLKLRKGDTVKVLYDIIPYLTFDNDCAHSDGELFEMPDVCPECGKGLEYTTQLENNDEVITIASCTNKKCPCRIKGKILNYLNKMNIDGISYGIIDRLYEYGFVENILDLYKLEKYRKEIIKIPGFGKTSVESWIQAIDNSRTVPDYVMLGALGIEGISKKTFSKILTKLTIDELVEACANNDIALLITIPSIKNITAKKIIEGINDNFKIIKKLKDNELTLLESKGKDTDGAFSVCFTKIRDEEKEKFIQQHGGVVNDNVTKNTTFVVVPDLNISSSKIRKAQAYNIPVIHIDDLEATITKYLSK